MSIDGTTRIVGSGGQSLGEAERFSPVSPALAHFGRRGLTRNRPKPEVPEPATSLPAHYDWARPEISSFIKVQDKCLLDVGCAAGAMGQALLERGAREVVGIELDHEAASWARRRLTSVYEFDVEKLPAIPYPEGYFDIVTLTEVLEYVREPGRVARHLLRWLKPGGTAVICFANVRHQDVLLSLLAHGDFRPEVSGLEGRSPLHRFTLNGMCRFCAALNLAMNSDVNVVASPPRPELEQLVSVVQALGGDVERFRHEALALRYVVGATSADAPASIRVTPFADPWRGSRPERLLLVPDLEDSTDDWQRILGALPDSGLLKADVTVGIALPAIALAEPPAVIAEIAEIAGVDLVLIEAPEQQHAKMRLFAGATTWLPSGARPELRLIAETVGVEICDAIGTRASRAR